MAGNTRLINLFGKLLGAHIAYAELIIFWAVGDVFLYIIQILTYQLEMKQVYELSKLLHLFFMPRVADHVGRIEL